MIQHAKAVTAPEKLPRMHWTDEHINAVPDGPHDVATCLLTLYFIVTDKQNWQRLIDHMYYYVAKLANTNISLPY